MLGCHAATILHGGAHCLEIKIMIHLTHEYKRNEANVRFARAE